MKTGNTGPLPDPFPGRRLASMEPGHEDREYFEQGSEARSLEASPQWSPVMKTGNTST